MHEISLTAQIPAYRHQQALHILAGLTASRSTPIEEEHVIFTPARDMASLQAAIDSQKVGAQPRLLKGGDSHLVQLIRDVSDIAVNHIGGQSTSERSVPRSQNVDPEDQWIMRLLEVPEPGVKTHSMRAASYSDVVTPSGVNVSTYMTGLGFKQTSTYNISGHRFVSNNAVLLVYRVMRSRKTATGSELLPFDPSNSFILSASIRVADGSKPALVKQAQQELDALKARLKGAIDLRAPDRLTMDTRAR